VWIGRWDSYAVEARFKLFCLFKTLTCVNQGSPQWWWWPVSYAENFHGWIIIQWRMVVICIWCALFV